MSRVSPAVLYLAGASIGLLGGLGAARLADVLPARHHIEPPVTGRPRARRNGAVILLSVAIATWLAHLVAGAPEVAPGRAAFYLATNLLLSLALITAAAVDLEHMVLPNELTLGGAALALATAHWRGVGLTGALFGAAVGLALTYLPFLLYKKLRGRSGMGLGDAKLAVFAGAWLGAQGVIFVVFAAAVQSALCALLMRSAGVEMAVPASVQAELAALRARAEAGEAEAVAILADDPMAADVGEHEGDAKASAFATMRLPMGPFLVLSCLEFLVGRRWILAGLDRLLSPS